MASFNENLDIFLTECRDDALDELNSNESYLEWKKRRLELRGELEVLIAPDTQSILEKYDEITAAIESYHMNTAYLRGLTMFSDIRKRFDSATLEYKAFADEFM